MVRYVGIELLWQLKTSLPETLFDEECYETVPLDDSFAFRILELNRVVGAGSV